MRSPTRLAALALVAAAPAAAQPAPYAPTIDSLLALNRSGQWAAAAVTARAALAAASAPNAADACVLRAGLLWAETRLAHRDSALAVLRAWDEACAPVPLRFPTLAAYVRDVERARDELTAPPLPTSGVDVSAVAEFYALVDTLARDATPSDAQWRRVMQAPGYRLYGSADQLRRLLPVAFMPSMRARRDSIARVNRGAAAALAYFDAAVAARADLTRFADSLAHADLTGAAVPRAAALLPLGATRGFTPPLVAFAIFGPDGYAQDGGIVIDLAHARALGTGLPLMVAHELHHEILGDLSTTRVPDRQTADGAIARALFQLRNEGIADLVDKPYPLPAASPGPPRYAELYNALYAAAPDSLRRVDSLFAVLLRDGTRDSTTVRRLFAALPFGGHPYGAYMARTIQQTFGRDSLMLAVPSQFAFARLYAEAERKRGAPVPFSAETLAALDALERKYRK